MLKAQEMEKFYFTCGQAHSHSMSKGRVWNRDSVLQVNAQSENDAIVRVYELFGDQWSNVYNEQDVQMDLYPNGICYVIYV